MIKMHLRKILNLEILFLIACLSFFIMIFAATYQMYDAATYRLPRVLSGFGIAVTLVIFIVKFNKIHARSMEIKAARKTFEGTDCFLIMFLSALYFFVMQFLGFIFTTGAAIFGFSLLMRYENKKIAIAAAIVLTFLIYFIFVMLLEVSLPMGHIERWLV